ncbi:MAG: hypothetical protein GY950_33555, partial [bacterium]|nr:hypothetical protein [bacterium]
MTFREKLLQLSSTYDVEKSPKRISEYQKMIRYGVMGELSEDYYLFIYRDLFRNSAYYGAIIFLNRADALGNPVRILCLEQDGVEQTRNVYIRAALFFLKNENDNTMEVAGKITEVFNRAREKVNEFMDGKVSARPELKNYNFDVSDQEVKYKEIETKQFDRQIENRNLKRQLEKLADMPGTGTPVVEKPRARLGLNLKIDFMSMEEGKKILLLPVVIPLKQNNQYGNPKKLNPTEVSKYEFIDLPPLLENFLNHFFALDHHLFSDSLKTKIINQLYFSHLAEEAFALPPELRYCQAGSMSKAYRPLRTAAFSSVKVSFAPSLKKETV